MVRCRYDTSFDVCYNIVCILHTLFFYVQDYQSPFAWHPPLWIPVGGSWSSGVLAFLLVPLFRQSYLISKFSFALCDYFMVTPLNHIEHHLALYVSTAAWSNVMSYRSMRKNDERINIICWERGSFLTSVSSQIVGDHSTMKNDILTCSQW